MWHKKHCVVLNIFNCSSRLSNNLRSTSLLFLIFLLHFSLRHKSLTYHTSHSPPHPPFSFICPVNLSPKWKIKPGSFVLFIDVCPEGFPSSVSSKELYWFDPWVGKIPWRKKQQATPVFSPGESHAQRSLASYSPQCHKEFDKTEVTACMHMPRA